MVICLMVIVIVLIIIHIMLGAVIEGVSRLTVNRVSKDYEREDF